MFVQTEVRSAPAARSSSLPASAISYAPYGDSVFVVTDLKNEAGQTYRGVRQQFVKLGPARGDQIAVVSGVKPAMRSSPPASSSCATARPCVINNTVQPANNPTPKPENS